MYELSQHARPIQARPQARSEPGLVAPLVAVDRLVSAVKRTQHPQLRQQQVQE
jgi:hypothetical protein